MKNITRYKILFITLSVIFLCVAIHASSYSQVISATEKKFFKLKEDTLKRLSKDLIVDSLQERRMRSKAASNRFAPRSMRPHPTMIARNCRNG